MLDLIETIEWSFSKLHGLGNDFVVGSLQALPERAKSKVRIQHICNRNFGIGCDGLMLVDETEFSQTSSSSNFSNLSRSDILVEMYNPDGSIMGMCGNGIRCVVKYLCQKFLFVSAEFRFSVHGRRITCITHDAGCTVRVDMGSAIVEKKQLDLNIAGSIVLGSVVSLGNPHYVIINQELEQDLLGPIIEKDPHFPNRTNVEFVSVISRNQIELKVWERGVGWTLACGTGACAAVFAAFASGLVDDKCKASLPGGDLLIECGNISTGNDSKMQAFVYMTGAAKSVFIGKICL